MSSEAELRISFARSSLPCIAASYVLEGEAEFTIGDETVRAPAGTWLSIPVGTVHGFRNAQEDELRILNIHVPNTGFIARLRKNA